MNIRVIYEKKRGEVVISLSFEQNEKLAQNLRYAIEILEEISAEMHTDLITMGDQTKPQK